MFNHQKTDTFYIWEYSSPDDPKKSFDIIRNNEVLGRWGAHWHIYPSKIGITCAAFIWRSTNYGVNSIEAWYGGTLLGTWASKAECPIDFPCPICPEFGLQTISDRVEELKAVVEVFPHAEGILPKVAE